MISAQCFLLLSFLVARTSCKMEGYIVGGNLANIANYPHAAFLSLSCKLDDLGSWMCGSSIINQDIVLTAAHCLHSCAKLQRISINAGSSKRNEGYRTSGSKFVIHEDYDCNTNDNDLALVRMKHRLTFGPSVKRVVILKEPPPLEPMTQVEVAGWGLINEIVYKTTVDLMSLSQVIWNTDDCEELYGTIGPGSFCAGSLVPGRYVAQGDSGSALMVKGYIQIGIVSYKIPDVSDELIVYTNASYYLNWIKFHAKRLYCRP